VSQTPPPSPLLWQLSATKRQTPSLSPPTFQATNNSPDCVNREPVTSREVRRRRARTRQARAWRAPKRGKRRVWRRVVVHPTSQPDPYSSFQCNYYPYTYYPYYPYDVEQQQQQQQQPSVPLNAAPDLAPAPASTLADNSTGEWAYPVMQSPSPIHVRYETTFEHQPNPYPVTRNIYQRYQYER